MTGPHREPILHVSDRAIASIAAHLAATTPGVARLHPALVRALKRTATDALRQHIRPTSTERSTADPGAVIVDAPADADGPRVVTVRIIATGEPPVLATATHLQRRIRDELQRITGQDTDIRVFVAALDPALPDQAPVTDTTQISAVTIVPAAVSN